MTLTASSVAQQIRCMQPILLEVADGENLGTYPSLVLDFVEGESLTVGVPLERGREVRIPPETPVNVQIARPDGVYVLPSQVVRRYRKGPALMLRWPARQDRIQRRNHVRIAVRVPMAIWTRAKDAAKVGDQERLITGISLDLSAGGVRLALSEPLLPGDQVRVELRLPDGERVGLEAHVLRSGENSAAAASERFWIALEFVGMLESSRKELTRFVFDVQREQMRRGVA